jgi:hypothetical protein
MAKRGRAAVATISDSDRQSEALEVRKRHLHAQEAERLRLCAERAGLNTNGIDDTQLEAAFKDLASRCRTTAAVASDAPPKSGPPARSAATAHD